MIYSEEYFAIPPRQIGLAAPKKDSELLRALAVYLSSTLVDYFVFFQVPEWGIYTDYPIVVLKAVRKIPTPDFTASQVATLAKAHRLMVAQDKNQHLLSVASFANGIDKQCILDQTVFDALAIPNDLRQILTDFRDTRLQLTRSYSALDKLVKPPSIRELQSYGRTLRDELERFLLGEAQVSVNIINSSDFVHCEVKMRSGVKHKFHGLDVTDAATNPKTRRLLHALREKLKEKFSQWTYVERSLKVFEEDAIQLYKAPRLIDWTNTQALNDADEIISEILSGGVPAE